MNSFAEEVMLKRIERTIKALEKNNMKACYVRKKEDIIPVVCSYMKEGESVTHGGTETLTECGLKEILQSGKYDYLDRSMAQTREEIEEIYRKSFFADNYICSANAITEDGMLYNVDGNSNRIAAIAYGPKSVIVIAGYNKIVRNIDEAVNRVKNEAAPPNCIRLRNDTPCSKTGRCVSYAENGAASIGKGCISDDRICCNYLISSKQRQKGRIKVIIAGEILGF